MEKEITALKEQLNKVNTKISDLEQRNIILLDAINKISEGIDSIIETANENFEALIQCRI